MSAQNPSARAMPQRAASVSTLKSKGQSISSQSASHKSVQGKPEVLDPAMSHSFVERAIIDQRNSSADDHLRPIALQQQPSEQAQVISLTNQFMMKQMQNSLQ